MRALWSDRPNCSHNVSQKLKRIRRFSYMERWKKESGGKPSRRTPLRRGHRPLIFSSSLNMGSLAKGFLRKVCRSSAENSRKFAKNTFYCVRKGCENSAESLRNFAGIAENFLDPFPNDPILSELLIYGPFYRGGRFPPWRGCPKTAHQAADSGRFPSLMAVFRP